MAIQETRSSGSSGLAFIVGGLVVAVAVLAYIVFGDGMSFVSGGGGTTVNVESSAGAPADTGDGAADTGASGGTEGSTGN